MSDHARGNWGRTATGLSLCIRGGFAIRLLTLLLVASATARTAGQTPTRDALEPAEIAAQIDRTLEAYWKEKGIRPAAAADDATFYRRLHLDLQGQIPSGQDARAFVENREEAKRADAIAAALASPEHAEYWARRWSDELLASAPPTRGSYRLEEWLVGAVAQDLPLDQMTHALLAGDGTTEESGALAFLAAYRDSREALTAVTAETFLGLQLQCAQCHDHPEADWTQRDFEGFASFFTAARIVPIERSDGVDVVYSVNDRDRASAQRDALGRLAALLRRSREEDSDAEPAMGGRRTRMEARRMRRSFEQGLDDDAFDALVSRLPAEFQDRARRAREREQRFGEPRFLGAEVYTGDGSDSRQALAHWITRADNEWFAKAQVNRVFAHLFGYGLVEPVDDLDAGVSELPGLLHFLADQFRRSDYSLRWLLESLTRTDAYALSLSTVRDAADRETQERSFAAHPLRALSAEQILDSLRIATGFDGRRRRAGPADTGPMAERRMRQRIAGVFGESDDEAVSRFDAGLPQALFLMNGRLTNDALELRASPVLRDIVESGHSPTAIVSGLFFATLGREPTPKEARALRSSVHRDGRAQADRVTDLYWALLNSSEFVTNH